MKIRELTLKNYRAFEEQTILFSDRFTVIAGINGKGKTAILDAVALLASRLLPLISPARSGYRTMGQSDIHGNEPMADLGFKVNCAGTPIEFKLSYSRDTHKLNRNYIPMAVRDQVKRAYGDPTRAGDQAPLVVYYTTDRAGYRLPKSLPRTLPREQSLAYVRALRSRMIDYRDFMARYKVWTGADGQLRSVRAFNTALGVFLEGFSQLQIQESPLRLSVMKGNQTLYLDQLSDGERSLLAIIADLVRRLTLANPVIDDPLQGAGVVLIDELELHLHPSWQRTVIEKLRTTFPNIQFIATTHSPFILQTAREGEVISLDGELVIEPAGRTIEEVSRLVMGVTNTTRSPRHQQMLDVARRYLELVEEARVASPRRREQIHNELVSMLAPFSDNPAYSALLERRGLTTQES